MFLDEITETTPAFQARLLRVLQDGAFERLGGEQTLTADVRIIAATNKDLKAEVDRGRFREDLYYRLQGFTLTLPPLRERPNDIPLLATHFLEKHGYQKVSSLSDRACEQMQTYRWPGNVRELENVIRRAAILAQSEGREMIQQVDLPKEIRESEFPQFEQGVYHSLDDQILSLLRVYKFSRSAISQTARALDNRDRGTITEYLRGLCFEALVKNDFDLEQSAREIAGTNEDQVIERVKTKIKGYLHNLKPFSGSLEMSSMDSDRLPSCYQGLPKKYHPLLDQIIENLPNIH
jgi:transcriptional regulator with GAF, ATPase, and Fis domain